MPPGSQSWLGALSALTTRARTLEAELAALDARLSRLAAELASFPDETPAVRAHHGLERARAEEERARARAIEEDAALGRAAQARRRPTGPRSTTPASTSCPAPDEPAGLDRVANARSLLPGRHAAR